MDNSKMNENPKIEQMLFVDSDAIARCESVEMLIILDILSIISQIDSHVSKKTEMGDRGWVEKLPWVGMRKVAKEAQKFGIDDIGVSIEIMKAMSLVDVRAKDDKREIRVTPRGVQRRIKYLQDQAQLEGKVESIVRANLKGEGQSASSEALYEEFCNTCIKLVAKDIESWTQYSFILINIKQEAWAPRTGLPSELREAIEKLARDWRRSPPSEYITKLFLMCELYVLYALTSFENTLPQHLESLEYVTLYLDTNVLVSLLVEEDRWHPITVTFLKEVEKVNNKKNSDFVRLRVSEMTLEELSYLIEHTQDALRSLSYARTESEAKRNYRSFAKDNSIVLEYFKGRRYPTVNALFQELARRLQIGIKKYGITVEVVRTDFDPGVHGSDVENIRNSLSGHRDPRNIRHKIYLIRSAQADASSSVSTHSWIWSYNRDQIKIEEALLDTDRIQFSIYGRYIRGILDPLKQTSVKLLQKDFSEYFLASALYSRAVSALKSEVIRLRDAVLSAGVKRGGLSSDEQYRLLFSLHMDAESDEAAAKRKQEDETLATIRSIMSDGEVVPSEI